ncbi:MAG: hypothetical protein KAT93_01510 [Desulfuromonadales bacterium]|nr:hypothetical protein [Desulfuromonadales bacterium]
MKQFLVLIAILLVLPVFSYAEPVREQGITMQMLPERMAKLDGKPWGFWVDYADYLMPENRQPVLQTTVEFMTFVQKQKPEVQANGVWIVIFNPGAYSDGEDALFAKVKSACKNHDIPLFVRSATDPPLAWRKQ